MCYMWAMNILSLKTLRLMQWTHLVVFALLMSLRELHYQVSSSGAQIMVFLWEVANHLTYLFIQLIENSTPTSDGEFD